MAEPKKPRQKSGSETRRTYARPIQIRVTPAERLEFESLAAQMGLSVPSFIRAMILTDPEIKATRRPTLDRVLMADLLGKLGKLGNNINQIAHRLNEGRGVGSNRMAAALDDFAELKNKVLEALNKLE